MAIGGPEAKRCRLDPSCPNESLFTDRVDNVVLTHSMQFLEAGDVLRLAKTCKRFAYRYSEKLRDLRHYDKFSEFCMQLKDSSGMPELILAASGQASWRSIQVVAFSSSKPAKAKVDLRISDGFTRVFVTFGRYTQSPFNGKPGERFTEWKCFVQDGSHAQAFILLAEYISKRFAFEKLRFDKLNLRTSEALSKLPFIVSDKLEISGRLNEESLLLWCSNSSTSSLLFTFDAARNLGRELFDDKRIASRKSLALRFRDGQFETESQVLYEHLEAWMGKMKRFELLNTESYVTYEDFKKLIEKWKDSELEIELWSFAIAMEGRVTLRSIFNDLQDTFHIPGGFLGVPFRASFAGFSWLSIFHQTNVYRSLRIELQVQRRQFETTILMVRLFDGSLNMAQSAWNY